MQGKLGKVVIFQPPKHAPVGFLRKGEDAAKAVLRNKMLKNLAQSYMLIISSNITLPLITSIGLNSKKGL